MLSNDTGINFGAEVLEAADCNEDDLKALCMSCSRRLEKEALRLGMNE